ncbi:MAG: acyltransferase family protein [Bacteroidetes bacterium]|nr:acyltransferase family protein [Bacteroidota bacterium]
MTRLHDLDALRSFAMLLGLLLHGALFLVGVEGWPFNDPWSYTLEPHYNPYAFMIMIVHGFRMPVFFLISGFFTAMLWQSRGWNRLADHRIRRIGIPLLIGMITIVPLNSWVMEGIDFSPLHNWFTAWLGGFDHLWFLWYLLWMVAIFLILVKLRVQFKQRLWWLLIPLSIIPMYLMKDQVFGADSFSPTIELIPPLHLLAYYSAFFFFGAFFYQRNYKVHRWWTAMILPSVLVLFPVGIALVFPEILLESTPSYAWLGTSVVQTAYAWLMSFGFMGLFNWIASKERRWVRYMSDASYWIYLWHFPLVVLAQMFLVHIPMNPHLKFFLLCTTILAILLVMYQAGVRYTFIGAALNGRRIRPTNQQGTIE